MLSKKYNLVCLTAFSHNIDAQKNRIQNLEYYFGNAISEIRFVGIRDSKEEELKLYCKQHNVVLFVDDNEIHVKMATDLIGKNRVYHLKDSSQWTNLASILLKQRSAG